MALPVHKWTMMIDLDKCTGCGACVVACHAENNVPVQTEREITRLRAMHWIRIERYWKGAYPDVQARFLPVQCQQCGNAPCEPHRRGCDGLGGQRCPQGRRRQRDAPMLQEQVELFQGAVHTLPGSVFTTA